MTKRPLSLLEGALLGLLHDEPRSGYALRKLFATTPMGHFSDSPGSIYPALARLAHRGLIAGIIENARSLRPRQVYRLTAAGLGALEGWLREPMSPGGMSEDFSSLLLRFVFMSQTIGRAETVRFLATLEIELKRQVAELRKYYRQAVRILPTPGRLGMRAGIEICAAHARWASLAHRTLAGRDKSKERP
jgi:DNA-binding PadR family transcriptional regulator